MNQGERIKVDTGERRYISRGIAHFYTSPMRSMSDRRALALAALALASAFCASLLVARWVYPSPAPTGSWPGTSSSRGSRWRRRSPSTTCTGAASALSRLLPLAALWLLFLPNAPYLLTDLIHLGSRDDAPLWFDLVLFSAFAWTGAFLGFLSIYLMQVVVRRAHGALLGWALVGGSLLASGFGIYLGRSLRWNSWDFVTSPSLSSPTCGRASPIRSLTLAPWE